MFMGSVGVGRLSTNFNKCCAFDVLLVVVLGVKPGAPPDSDAASVLTQRDCVRSLGLVLSFA